MNMAAVALAPPLPVTGAAPSEEQVQLALLLAAANLGELGPLLVVLRRSEPLYLASRQARCRWVALAALARVFPECEREVGAQLGCPQGLAGLSNARRVGDWWREEHVDLVARALAGTRQNGDHDACPAWFAATAVAATHAGVAVEEVRRVDGRRGWRPKKSIWRAKRIAAYLAVSVGNGNCNAVARASGLHKSTVQHHVDTLAKEREADDLLDAELDALEEAVSARLDGAA